MNELHYPIEALRGDYLRAGLGVILTLAPALGIPLASPAMYVLVPAAILFLAFGVRTWRRHRSRVVLDRRSISIFGPRRVSLDWERVRSVKLSYFSTRADRTGGWMQLTLSGNDAQREGVTQALCCDSTLTGFEVVAHRAAAAIQTNGLTVSQATRANFSVLGIDVADPAEPALHDHFGTTAAARRTG
jgi:hypothetical protein